MTRGQAEAKRVGGQDPFRSRSGWYPGSSVRPGAGLQASESKEGRGCGGRGRLWGPRGGSGQRKTVFGKQKEDASAGHLQAPSTLRSLHEQDGDRPVPSRSFRLAQERAEGEASFLSTRVGLGVTPMGSSWIGEDSCHLPLEILFIKKKSILHF